MSRSIYTTARTEDRSDLCVRGVVAHITSVVDQLTQVVRRGPTGVRTVDDSQLVVGTNKSLWTLLDGLHRCLPSLIGIGDQLAIWRINMQWIAHVRDIDLLRSRSTIAGRR